MNSLGNFLKKWVENLFENIRPDFTLEEVSILFEIRENVFDLGAHILIISLDWKDLAVV